MRYKFDNNGITISIEVLDPFEVKEDLVLGSLPLPLDDNYAFNQHACVNIITRNNVEKIIPISYYGLKCIIGFWDTESIKEFIDNYVVFDSVERAMIRRWRNAL